MSASINVESRFERFLANRLGLIEEFHFFLIFTIWTPFFMKWNKTWLGKFLSIISWVLIDLSTYDAKARDLIIVALSFIFLFILILQILALPNMVALNTYLRIMAFPLILVTCAVFIIFKYLPGKFKKCTATGNLLELPISGVNRYTEYLRKHGKFY